MYMHSHIYLCRYKKILEEILKVDGNELVDNIKAFVEACEYIYGSNLVFILYESWKNGGSWRQEAA